MTQSGHWCSGLLLCKLTPEWRALPELLRKATGQLEAFFDFDHRPRAKRVVDKIEIYNKYSIRAFESSPGKWTAEIRKVDGSPIQILPTGLEDDAQDCLTTDPEMMTAEAAIELAKEAIDSGSMR